MAVSLGDAQLLDSLLWSSGPMACTDAYGHAEPDTARTLLAFCVLTSFANSHAADWWLLNLRAPHVPEGEDSLAGGERVLGGP